jgi:hypothetical protein
MVRTVHTILTLAANSEKSYRCLRNQSRIKRTIRRTMPRWEQLYGPQGKLRKLVARTLRTVGTQNCALTNHRSQLWQWGSIGEHRRGKNSICFPSTGIDLINESALFLRATGELFPSIKKEGRFKREMQVEFGRFGDASVQRASLFAQQGAISSVLHQGVLEQVGRVLGLRGLPGPRKELPQPFTGGGEILTSRMPPSRSRAR